MVIEYILANIKESIIVMNKSYVANPYRGRENFSKINNKSFEQ